MHWDLTRREDIQFGILQRFSKYVDSYTDQLGFEPSILHGLLEQALLDCYVLRKSRFALLGGKEQLPPKIGRLKLQSGQFSYRGSNIRSPGPKAKRLLFYLLEYQNDTFIEQDFEDFDWFSDYPLRKQMSRFSSFLDTNRLPYEVVKRGPTPISFGIRFRNLDQRINLFNSTSKRVSTEFISRVKNESGYSRKVKKRDLGFLVQESMRDEFESQKDGEYVSLGGDVEVPNQLKGVYFHDGFIFTDQSPTKVKEASSKGILITYLLAHCGQMTSGHDLAEISLMGSESIRKHFSSMRRFFEGSGFELRMNGPFPRQYGVFEK